MNPESVKKVLCSNGNLLRRKMAYLCDLQALNKLQLYKQ